MALRRKDIRDILANADIADDAKIGQIMDLVHTETDALRDELDQANNSLREANATIEANKTAIADKDAEIAKAQKAFDDYKTADAESKATEAKATAYRALLKQAGISDKRIDTVMKVTDLTDITLNKDGSIRDAEKVSAGIAESWADFIPVETTTNSQVATPPSTNIEGDGLTKADIMAMKDRTARRQAIREHPDLFK